MECSRWTSCCYIKCYYVQIKLCIWKRHFSLEQSLQKCILLFCWNINSWRAWEITWHSYSWLLSIEHICLAETKCYTFKTPIIVIKKVSLVSVSPCCCVDGNANNLTLQAPVLMQVKHGREGKWGEEKVTTHLWTPGKDGSKYRAWKKASVLSDYSTGQLEPRTALGRCPLDTS